MKKIILVLFIISLALPAQTKMLEKDYQNLWCTDGIKEYVLPDKSRVDCLLADYAIEVEFAHKWKEAVGQSLYYGLMTNRQPGILLIMNSPNDEKYLKRLQVVTDRYNIKVWTYADK